MPKVTLQRPEPIEFILPGVTIIVQPVTRAQMRAALALDPQIGEFRGPSESAEQRARQLRALVGEEVLVVREEEGGRTETPAASGPILEALSPDEEMQMLGALTAQGHGLDPAAQNALHEMVKKKAVLSALIGSEPLTATPANSASTSGAAPATPKATDL